MHEDPLPAIKQTKEYQRGFDLWRRVEKNVGSEEYKLVANRDINEKEVISWLGGKLMESHKAETEGLDRHLHFYLDKGYLAKYYAYQGKQPLVLSMKNNRNIATFIRDPALLIQDEEEEMRPDLAEYNVKVDLSFDKDSQLFFVLLFAW